MIYLDNAATTKPSEKVISEIFKNLSVFYNPSASYALSTKLNENIESIKKNICTKICACEGNIIFTASASEANNLAIFGCLKKNFKRLIFSSGEHPSVYNSAMELKKNGFDVQFIKLQKNGEIDYLHLEELLKYETSFVSVMAVSNETGAINDIKKIGDLVKSKYPNAIFHSDAVQGFSKIHLSVSSAKIDFLTMSAHKAHGPKGIGFLYAKNKNILKPIIFGGGQEYGIRSGTENTPFILSLNEILNFDIDKNFEYVLKLKTCFLENLISEIKINSGDNCSPYIVSFSLDGVRGETILHMLENDNIIVGTGSACSSKKAIKNITLNEIGLSKSEIEGSLRISFSIHNTTEEVVLTAKKINEYYLKLRNLVRINKWTKLLY